MMKIMLALFSRQWILATLLVFAGVLLCFRLGYWQFDRLKQRRVFNEHVASVWNMEPLNLNNPTA